MSGRRAFGAEAVSDPARREEGVQFPIPPAKRRTRQTLRVRSNTIQVPLSGINKKRDHGPIMVRDGDPVEPDAGPVIKSGFYRADPVTESHKVYRYDTEWAEVLAI